MNTYLFSEFSNLIIVGTSKFEGQILYQVCYSYTEQPTSLGKIQLKNFRYKLPGGFHESLVAEGFQ